MKEALQQAISQALPGVEFVVERPRDMRHGDYATNAALVGKVDAQELASKLKIEGVEKVEVVGKFINFFLTREALLPKEQEVAQFNKGKKILVEYTDPNPFKEFHIGHLMSNAIGESIARLLSATGAEVSRANYQGDVGPHVAKAIWGKMQKPDAPWGEAYTYGAQEYDAHKEEIDSINKKVYDRSDAEINALYDQGRKESLERFEHIYRTLGTKFDHYFFESETGPKGLEIVRAHPELFVESQGAIVFHGAHTRVFINSQGLPTYEAKELGLAQMKRELGADEYVYVTASEQNGFFEVVFEAIQKVFADLQGKLAHRSHGMMRFAQGKMSSRTGNVITGESLLEDLTKAAREREDVAVGAIKYAVLKSGSGKDIVFDPEKSLSLEGDSGPYVQYALVRSRALLRKAGEAQVVEAAPPESNPLERVLIHYAEVVERSARELEPHYLTTYLTELASTFNTWYATERAIVDGSISSYTLGLVKAVERTLAEGLNLLGIPTPEEM